jgi:hypothetical protein
MKWLWTLSVQHNKHLISQQLLSDLNQTDDSPLLVHLYACDRQMILLIQPEVVISQFDQARKCLWARSGGHDASVR